jgi:hypothetical protein
MPAVPIIVTALFADADFAQLDALRRAHFPPERNQVPAHLTLFHHLPPSLGDELSRRLREETSGIAAPAATISGAINLGRGVALRIRSDGLAAIRDRLAEAFAGVLTPQDSAGWRPHVTIQNKVEPAAARALLTEMDTLFARPKPLGIVGLASWHYLGGPWAPIARFRFR